MKKMLRRAGPKRRKAIPVKPASRGKGGKAAKSTGRRFSNGKRMTASQAKFFGRKR